MTTSRADRAYHTIWLVRRLFRALASRADDYLGESGLSAADRAVIEFLYPDEQLSVPDIARRYNVSRQHVQITANRLLDNALLESVPNPRHKRSRLVQLTPEGQAFTDEMRARERTFFCHSFRAALLTTAASHSGMGGRCPASWSRRATLSSAAERSSAFRCSSGTWFIMGPTFRISCLSPSSSCRAPDPARAPGR